MSLFLRRRFDRVPVSKLVLQLAKLKGANLVKVWHFAYVNAVGVSAWVQGVIPAMYIYINHHSVLLDKQIHWISVRESLRFVRSLLTFMVTGYRRSRYRGIYLEHLLRLWKDTWVCRYKHIAHILIQVKICIYCVLSLFEARLALWRTSIEKSCLHKQERRLVVIQLLYFISGYIPFAMVLACSIFVRPP